MILIIVGGVHIIGSVRLSILDLMHDETQPLYCYRRISLRGSFKLNTKHFEQHNVATPLQILFEKGMFISDQSPQ